MQANTKSLTFVDANNTLLRYMELKYSNYTANLSNITIKYDLFKIF